MTVRGLWSLTRSLTVSCEEGRKPPSIGQASIAANSSNEDRFRVYACNGVTVATVADGHGSHSVSQFVVDRLPEELLVAWTRPKAATAVNRVEAAFRHVDSLLRDSMYKSAAAEWHAGSCALSALVTDSSVLVANTGDSRALLVKRAAKPGGADDVELPEGTLWVSELHTADSLSEQERLHALHPNERDVVHCRQKIIELDGEGKITSMRWAACYVKGRLQPTRAFGDFYLKDERAVDVCPELVPASSFSPPYIEVTPSINEWQRESGSLLVLATDGLWDYVSPQQVVDLVRRLPRDDVQAMAAGLIDLALEIAAEATAGEFSVADLKAMPQGYERRSIHDDITVLVIAL